MEINTLVKESHRVAREHGWWDHKTDKRPLADEEVMLMIPEKIALMHSELSEALEAYRVLPAGVAPYTWTGENGKPEGILSEFADCIIRIADLCGRLGLDLEEMLITKQKFNETRSYRHGGRSA